MIKPGQHNIPLEYPDGDRQSDISESAEYASTEAYEDYPRVEECWRHRFLCPAQGRFFGDRGSFVDYFDPLRGGQEQCSERNIAPFGPIVVWRVLSTFNCEEGCDLYDDAIDAGILPIPVVVRRSPFGNM